MPVAPSALGHEVVRIVAAITTLSGIAVALRLFTRFGLIKHAGPDDYLIVFAFIFSCTFTGLVVDQVRYGLGRHQDTVPSEDVTNALKPFYFSIMAYNLSLTFTKASILAQYLRLIVEQRMRRICYGMITVITLYGIWLFFTGVFTCTPIHKFWDVKAEGKCLNERTLWFTNAGLNIATDFIIFVLPLPVIHGLNLPTRQKILLIGIFTIGLFTCITSIVRLGALSKVANSADKTYDNAMAASWSSIEINTGIFCGCVSTLRPLVSRLAPGALSSHRSTKETGGTGPRESRNPQNMFNLHSHRSAHDYELGKAAHRSQSEENFFQTRNASTHRSSQETGKGDSLQSQHNIVQVDSNDAV